ncbi:hypothetical protein CCACVL1_01056 [Corchorus capsularis]|uniref:Uncharacterized protein n=1 Tax=Corchorus capsularis TaxID=210143 RepID=A0A1R3KR28_COCAP|nr:hypothetical protein CCACVL1_01056 [Corchorus capsularis]
MAIAITTQAPSTRRLVLAWRRKMPQ